MHVRIKIIVICSLCALLIYSIKAQPRPVYKQFGNVIIDVAKPNKLTYLNGQIKWIQNGVICVEVKDLENAQMLTHSVIEAGANYAQANWIAVALTNFPDIKGATLGKEITVEALLIGTFAAKNNQPIKFYDCGMPYVPPPLTPEQIKLAEARAADVKQRAMQAQTNVFRRLQPDAASGDASAQFSLGLHYLNGQGCETNRDQAIYWFQKSAAQGNTEASNKLVRLKKE